MRVKFLDYNFAFTPEQLKGLANAGSDTLLCLTISTDEQVSETQFDFRRVVDYVGAAKAAGLADVHILAPVGAPPWMPDDWFCRNEYGDVSSLRYDLDPHRTFLISAHRITSYWNPTAEAYQQAYVKALRESVEPVGGKVIGSFGSCGEFHFTSSSWITGITGEHRKHGVWWFDDYATKSWRESGLDRESWWNRERMDIIKRRMSWGSEPWLSICEFYNPVEAGWRGVGNISKDLLTLDPRPQRILFTMFPDWIYRPVVKSGWLHQYKVWAGAEGAAGLVPNATKARDAGLPLEGLVCGPLFHRYENKIDADTYRQIEACVQI